VSAKRPQRYRILYANSHPYWGGGAEAVLLKLASSLNRAEFEPLLLTSKEDSLAARFREAGVETLTVPYGYFRAKHGFWDYYLRGPRTLRRLLRSRGIDLVHTNCDRSIRPLVRAATPLDIPVVSHVHDPTRKWFSRRFLPYLNRTAAIIAVSRWLEDFGRARGADPARLRVIYNGTEPEPFRAAALSREDTRRQLRLGPHDFAVGLFGSLEPRKGQEDLLRCAADPQLAGLSVHFFIVGGEPPGREGYGQHLRDLAASKGIASRVTFLGYRDDVPALMTAFDVSAAPFRDEGFPGVVVESLCAGLPVIGYRSGPVPEQVREYRDGLLVEPGDAVSLAAAICCLATNDQLRERMGAQARERSRDFTFQRHLDAMRLLYLQILRDKSPRFAATSN
jgi:glycosyltransferase involved in cell wall biosynthesis